MMMSNRIFGYTKGQIDRAIECIIAAQDHNEIEKSRKIINEWRSYHKLPMLAMYMRLKRYCEKNHKTAIVSTRIKRFVSIIEKIKHRKHSNLSTMQDLGGCRVVLDRIDDIYKLKEKITKKTSCFEFIKCNDYMQNPHSSCSGYRGIHLIFGYRANEMETKVKIEVQLRTIAQHWWATTVETIDAITGQSLKSGRGDDKYKDFFLIVSKLFQKYDETLLTCMPKKEIFTGIRKTDEYKEFTGNKEYLEIKNRIESISHKNNHCPQLKQSKEGILLNSDPTRKKGIATAELCSDIAEYYELEEKQSNNNIVLVYTRSPESIPKAFPNYFQKVNGFVKLLNEIVD